MGKVILTMQMSLDGIVSDVEQWMTLSDEFLEDTLEYYETLDAIVVGGATYPSLANYWQNAEKASDSALERRLAKKINEIKKIAISRSKLELVWNNSELIVYEDQESLVREIEHLKKSLQKDISVESGLRTWQFFIRNALFDDLWLGVQPVVVAQGDKLFADAGAQLPLQLISSKVYPNGVVGLYYERGAQPT